MATREIRTKLTVDSEKEFNREIKEAGRNMRVMASEMKAAAADFNLTGNEMDYLTRKSGSLNSQIKQQEAIIKALEGAVASSAATWGEASEKTDGYRIKLSNAQASMAKLRKELEETDAELAELGRDSARVGRQLEEGVGEAAEDVGDKFDSMVNKLDKDVANIGKTLDIAAGFTIGGQIVSGVTQVIDGIDSITSETEEYRRRMSFLEQNALTAGLDPDELKTIAMRVAAITGEMDGAIEGVSNLAAAGLNINEIATAADRLVAAAIMWPDTLKFESMADGLQESIATKGAVGQYAELLERLGLDIETVNKSLEETPDAQAAQTAAMAWMTEHGLEESLEEYRKNNEEMIAAADAQLQYNDSLAKFAEVLIPAKTEFTNFKTEVLKGTTELIDGGFQDWLNGINESLQGGLGMNDWMKNLLGEDLYNLLFSGERPKVEPGTYAGQVTEEELTPDLTVKPGAYAGAVDLGKVYGDATAQAYIETVGEKTDDVFDVNEAVEEARKDIASWDGMDDGTITDKIIDSASMEEAGEAGADAYVEGMNKRIAELVPKVPTWEELAPGYDTGIAEETAEQMIDTEALKEEGKTGGEAIMTGIDEGVEEAAPQAEANAEIIGENIGTSVSNGIVEATPLVASSAAAMFDAVVSELNKPVTIGGFGATSYGGQGATSYGGQGSVGKATIKLDGKKVGDGMVEYNNDSLGASVDRATMYAY